MKLQCDMERTCTAPVTHLEEKGYVYCAPHAKVRREHVGHRMRLLQPWEKTVLESGTPLRSYEPITLAEHQRLVQK